MFFIVMIVNAHTMLLSSQVFVHLHPLRIYLLFDCLMYQRDKSLESRKENKLPAVSFLFLHFLSIVNIFVLLESGQQGKS